MYRTMLFAISALVVSGCTWVKPVPGADKVELVPANLAANCKDMGSVTVSALDSVGGLNRHEEEVEEDLVMLAKNQAAEKGADTLVKLTAVRNGEQRFGMRNCGNSDNASQTQDDSDMNDSGAEDSGVEVVPYDN